MCASIAEKSIRCVWEAENKNKKNVQSTIVYREIVCVCIASVAHSYGLSCFPCSQWRKSVQDSRIYTLDVCYMLLHTYLQIINFQFVLWFIVQSVNGKGDVEEKKVNWGAEWSSFRITLINSNEVATCNMKVKQKKNVQLIYCKLFFFLFLEEKK